MPIPDVTINVQDGALGLVPSLNNNVVACVGVSSAGTANAVLSFGAGNVQAVTDALGTGPLVETAAALVQAGINVVTCKATTSTPGSQGAVTPTGGGTSVMTTTGTARDSYDVVVLVTKAGTNNVGDSAFKVSLDGGLNYGPETALPVAASYLVPNTGITLVFGAGTLVAGGTYSFTATGPVFDNTNLNTALTALMADARTWFLLNVVGIPADATAMQTFFGTISTQMASAAAKYRYARAVLSAPWGLTDAALITAMQALSSTRMSIAADWNRLTSAVSGASLKRGTSLILSLRAGQVDPGTDVAQFDLGALPGVVSINRNEEATPGLDVVGYSTLRTFIGAPGFYPTNFRLFGGPTSDFQFLQHGRCIDIACQVARVGYLRFLNSNLLVDKTTGKILESEAARIEAYVNAQLRAALSQPGYVTDVYTVVDRTNNILSTNQLLAAVRVIPKAYAKNIAVTIGFFNPSLNPV